MQNQRPLKAFIIYARADETFKSQLLQQLRPLVNQRAVEVWHDGNILPGEAWHSAIKDELASSELVLFLVSVDALNSESIWNDELKMALKQMQAGQTQVIPIIIRPCVWHLDPVLSHFQVLPLYGNKEVRAVNRWPDPEEAWVNIVENLNRLVQKMNRSRENPDSGGVLPQFEPFKAKRIPFWKTKSFKVIILILALLITGLVYLNFPFRAQSSNTSVVSPIAKRNNYCYFPAEFDSAKLYILISRFEDFGNGNETECYGRGIETRIDILKNRDKLPVVVCYVDSLSPNQSDEASRLRDRYGADIIIWGRLRNANANCQADEFCMNFQPSDTLVRYAGGQVPRKVDFDYQTGISASDLEKGLISIDSQSFDAWLISMVNLKIGQKKPDFYHISSDLPVKKQADEYTKRGELLLMSNLNNEAIADFTKTIELVSGNAHVYNNRGVAKLILGQNNAAVTDFTKAIELKFDNPSFYYNRGFANLLLGQNNVAITDFTKAIELKFDNPDAYYNRGIAKYTLGQKEAAIADYTKAIELEYNAPSVYYNRGLAKSDLGQNEAAIVDYTKAIELEHNDPSVYYNRGLAKYDLGQNEAAITDYTKAIEFNPSNYRAYCQRGVAKNALSQYQDAIADFTKTIEFKPNYQLAYSNRGLAKSYLGQNEAAIADYNKAIELNPNDYRTYCQRGVAKNALSQYQDAIADFTKTIEFKPNYQPAYIYRGVVQCALEQNEAAITDFTRAIILKPNFESYVNRGNAKSALGQTEDAIADYTKAIDLKADSPDAYFNRGAAKFDLGQNEAAIADYTKAIEFNAQFAVAYKSRGIAYWERGKYLRSIWDKTQAICIEKGWRFYLLMLLLGGLFFILFLTFRKKFLLKKG